MSQEEEPHIAVTTLSTGTKSFESLYSALIRRTRESAVLLSCIELLGWDELTYMPRDGSEDRAIQTALLTGLYHDKITDPKVGELLDVLEQLPKSPDSPAAINIRELRRRYRRATLIPRSLVEEMARVASVAQQLWQQAKEQSDFGYIKPSLEKLVVLKRMEADCVGHKGIAYDALIEKWEPGVTSDALTRLFADLRRDLEPLLQKVLARKQSYQREPKRNKYPLGRQQKLMTRLAQIVGFDFRRGRLDGSTQLFVSNIGSGDCRITTRYDSRQFTSGFFGVLHELGHALYEQGFDSVHYGTPMAESPSLGMHESQARLWENNVGRSLSFWKYFYPICQQIFPEALKDVSLQMFVRGVNYVEPTLIRVYADQLTYDLHVIVRFELERALIAGDLEVADIPDVWNQMYDEYLGIVPPSDTEGCLQDSHWGAGMFGSFPSYTLGNILAAQLFDAVRKALPGLEEQFENGQFEELLSWLRQHVYRHGRRYSSAELILNATGSEFDHRVFVASLSERYREIDGW